MYPATQEGATMYKQSMPAPVNAEQGLGRSQHRVSAPFSERTPLGTPLGAPHSQGLDVLGEAAERHVRLLAHAQPGDATQIAEYHTKLTQWKKKYQGSLPK